MPNLNVRIKAGSLPLIAVGGRVETLRDVRRLLANVDKRIREVTRMFPAETAGKVESVTIKPE